MKSKTQILKQALIVFGLMTGALIFVNMLPVAGAEILKPTDNLTGPETGNAGSLREVIYDIIKYFLGFLGLLAVIMVIYGGVTYVSSAGNDEAVGKAKKIIMYALIGLIVILLSFLLVKTVLGAGTQTE